MMKLMKLMNRTIIILIFAVFISCSERIAVSDAGSLGIRFKAKNMDESFYLAQTFLDSLVLHKKIYEHRYEFDYYGRYKSIEKNRLLNINDIESVNDSINSDSITMVFPFLFKEDEYMLTKFDYPSDTLSIAEYFDSENKLVSSLHKSLRYNRTISEKQFSPTGTLIGGINYRYDTRNRMVQKVAFNETGYTETNYAYSMDEKTETENDCACIYRYDIYGKVISKKMYRGVKQLSEISYGYNNHGDLVAETEIDSDGGVKKNRYEYVYDSQNNWKVCMEYNFSGNIFVRTRTITYY